MYGEAERRMNVTTEAARTARIDFQIVPTKQLPPGRSCSLEETANRIVVSLGDTHATTAVCKELSFLHRTLTAQGRWVQTSFGGNSDRIEQPAEGHNMARIVWERVPGTVLLSKTLAAQVERNGALLWLVHEDHISAALCAELCVHGKRIGGDGLWQQRWPS